MRLWLFGRRRTGPLSVH